ncbi:MAG TPA: PilC/PilY family type IV pilus protein [Rhodanobacteraceae bacterium]|nr:PilC/PilY family type IV pilus protein [Rhodanobacteraceae bacterium]
MKLQSLRNGALVAVLAVIAGGFGAAPVPAAPAPPPQLAVSQVPLTVAVPAHPQVLFAIGNSQSMDGDLSGAIMTGSGSLGGGLASLANSSSPVDYSVPAGFTPPVQAADASGNAPYTVTQNGDLVDNSASRLNVAKAGISAIINAYAATTDFALEDYSASASSVYTTWVYQMSGPGGFTFSSTDTTAPPAGFEYVANPCYQYQSASSTVQSNCGSIVGSVPGFSAATVGSSPYMLVSASSDDADVNDVLYWTGNASVFVDYGSRNKSNPYPPNFSLSNYDSGSVNLSYANVVPNNGIKETGPTNAGFVPFSDQVMYAERGFGYDASATATTGNVAVTIQSAGAKPTAASVQAVINAFQPSLAPETNQSGSGEIKALAVQSPIAGLMQKAKSYLAGVSNPGNCSKQYVILISDGLPTEDLAGNSWPPLGSAAAAGYGVSATFNSDGSLNTTNDQALTDTVTAITALQQAGIDTYVVGMGAGVDPTLNPQAAATLTAMAVAGGTHSYFAATSPSALVTDLNTILLAVQNGTVSATSVAVNSGSLDTDSTVYQATFTVSDTPYQDWTGDVQAYPINADGTIATTASWSAKALLDTQVSGTGWDTGRTIATWNPTAGTGEPFRWADLSAAQQADLAVTGDPTVTPPALSNAQLRLNYLRGDASHEVHNGGIFRNRSAYLGDIVDSNPLYVGQPQGSYSDASYASFAAQFVTTPRPAMLYVGANDGMLHAFNAATGQELFAFVPNAVFPDLAGLASPYYNANHHFYVDGQPAASDVLLSSDGKWHTELVGGEGAGGNSIYALDVTHPDTLTSESALASAVLWEFTDADMGLSFSVPIIVRTGANMVTDASSNQSVPGFAVMFGNGYNSASGQPIFYALKAGTGTVLAKIDLCTAAGVPPGTCNPNLPNGLSSVVAANSSGILGNPVSVVYAGDLQGNLWAIDVSNANPADWTVRVVFQARDASGNPQPITTPPVVTLNPNFPAKAGLMVYFGTGELLQASDLTSTNVESFYGVWDDGSTTPATRTDLQQQTVTTETAAAAGTPQAIRVASDNAVNWTTQQGWYYDLPLSGERVITPAVVESGGVIFNTYTPVAQSGVQCSVGGQSWLMDVGYATGGPFPQAELDVAGNGNLNSSKQKVNGSNPVGMSLGNGFVPTPSLIRTNLPNDERYLKIVDQNNGGTVSRKAIGERGHGPSRTGWWQIQ